MAKPSSIFGGQAFVGALGQALTTRSAPLGEEAILCGTRYLVDLVCLIPSISCFSDGMTASQTETISRPATVRSDPLRLP